MALRSSAVPESDPSTTRNPIPPSSTPLLAAAIYTPFTGIPRTHRITTTTTSPPSREQQLTTIIANLKAQHERVRQNMLYLHRREKDRIVEEARAALEADLKNSGLSRKMWEENNGKQWISPSKESILERNLTIERMTSRRHTGPSSQTSQTSKAPQRDSRGSLAPPITTGQGTAADRIRDETSARLLRLVTDTAVEMSDYDARAKASVAVYEQALVRAVQDGSVRRRSGEFVPTRPVFGNRTSSVGSGEGSGNGMQNGSGGVGGRAGAGAGAGGAGYVAASPLQSPNSNRRVSFADPTTARTVTASPLQSPASSRRVSFAEPTTARTGPRTVVDASRDPRRR